MKTKEKTALKNMSKNELMKVISETQMALAQYKVNRYSKQSKNVREGRLLARKIAVAKTFANEKETHEEK